MLSLLSFITNMDSKPRPIISFSKKKRHFCLFLVGITFLVSAVPYSVLLHRENGSRINEILKDVETLKQRLSSQDLEFSLKSQGLGGTNQGGHRKKRHADGHEEPQHVPKLYDSGGALYVRWGRTTCPDNYTELVYDGIAGGSWHDHQGAASNFQCLPNKPVWGRFTSGAGNAFLYGVEYNDAMSDIMDLSNVQNNLHNQNVPCAVCRSSVRVSPLMVPGKNDCFDGWNLEYHGYLMAGHHGSKASTQYICVDESPEADPAGYRDEDGALLHRVTAQCGSLPCPRYVQNREFTCAVCTK